MRSQGFSYIEVLFTVAIVAVMATAVMPYMEKNLQRQQEQALRDGLRQIRSAIDAYKLAVEQGQITVPADASGYPPTLDVLVDGVVDATDPAKSRLYFLRRLPRDPFFPNKTVPAAQSWGLRSYDSPPDNPQPGRDVFDVFSRSELVGLNGVPYREW